MRIYGVLEVPDVTIDEGRCNLCINCVRTCPMQALGIEGKKVVQLPEICFGCRNCMAVCESDAVSVRGSYRVIGSAAQIGYRGLRGFPPFAALAGDKRKLFEGKGESHE